MLKNYDNCFYRFGGHAGACGFTLYREHKDYLIKSLNKAVADILKTNPNLFDCDPEPDAVISASDISFELAEQIAAMEPFGEGNERPLFKIYNIHINKIWSMGKTGQYRKYICNDGNTVNFECIIFDSDIISESFVSEGDIVTLLGDISINSWNGKQSLQISVKKFINI